MISKNNSLHLRNILWAAVIFVLCTIPASKIPSSGWNIPLLDKIVHFFMFFVMAVLLYSELNYRTSLKTFHIWIIIILICAVYGGVIEILQESYFHRTGDIWDWVADVLGTVAGCAAYLLFRKIKNCIFKTGRAR